MHCPSCNLDRHPIIEGGQDGRFFYTCANAACHANLGPVRAAASAAIASMPPERAPAVIHISQAAATAPTDIVGLTRSRLAEVDAELARHDTLIAERRTLRRMIRAAEGGRRSNVVALVQPAAPVVARRTRKAKAAT
jgi:hypothetical protein